MPWGFSCKMCLHTIFIFKIDEEEEEEEKSIWMYNKECKVLRNPFDNVFRWKQTRIENQIEMKLFSGVYRVWSVCLWPIHLRPIHIYTSFDPVSTNHFLRTIWNRAIVCLVGFLSFLFFSCHSSIPFQPPVTFIDLTFPSCCRLRCLLCVCAFEPCLHIIISEMFPVTQKWKLLIK